MGDMLTPIQFDLARALAREFGHEWGNVPDGTYDIDAIAAWTRASRRPGQLAGIEAPRWALGDVMHTTTTGRLTWAIDGNGLVGVSVWRPVTGDDPQEVVYLQYGEGREPQVILSVIGRDGSALTVTSVQPPDLVRPFAQRHVQALITVLGALLMRTMQRPATESAREAYVAERHARMVRHAGVQLEILRTMALPDPEPIAEWVEVEETESEIYSGEPVALYVQETDDGRLFIIHEDGRTHSTYDGDAAATYVQIRRVLLGLV